tara:strand:+ start:5378 stop:5974 length:597 start_codon:yes stop_codon:yes gene_type:complete
MSVEYSVEQLKDIFEIVNAEHLHLKGAAKASAKRQFTTVLKRDNKSVSLFQLYMALYKSRDVYDSLNEWLKNYLNDPENNLSVNEVLSKNSIPYVKHIRLVRNLSEKVDELELELESVLEKNNLISREDHLQEMKQLNKSHLADLLLKEDEIQKLKNQLILCEKDCSSRLKTKDKYIKNLEKQNAYKVKESEDKLTDS